MNGKDVTPTSPRDALAEGIAYLTEDRKELGLFLDMSISDNINISVMENDSGLGGTRRFGKEEARARQSFENLEIKSPSSKITVGSLSGGNQQKVLLARLLEAKPKVIILDEPTRGVDVGAKSEIYRLIDGLANCPKSLACLIVCWSCERGSSLARYLRKTARPLSKKISCDFQRAPRPALLAIILVKQ